MKLKKIFVIIIIIFISIYSYSQSSDGYKLEVIEYDWRIYEEWGESIDGEYYSYGIDGITLRIYKDGIVLGDIVAYQSYDDPDRMEYPELGMVIYSDEFDFKVNHFALFSLDEYSIPYGELVAYFRDYESK